MAEITGLVIYDSILFQRGHMIHRWATGVERTFTGNARAAAPVNKRAFKSHLDAGYPPGSLKASITGSVDRIAPKHIQITSSVNVPYAMFVLYGTTGPITPRSKPVLTLPRNPGYGSRRKFKRVSGQRAQNFFATAAAATAARHPSLRGFDDALFEQT